MCYDDYVQVCGCELVAVSRTCEAVRNRAMLDLARIAELTEKSLGWPWRRALAFPRWKKAGSRQFKGAFAGGVGSAPPSRFPSPRTHTGIMGRNGVLGSSEASMPFPRLWTMWRIRTNAGALITMVSALLIVVLTIGEFVDYRTVHLKPSLEVDRSRGEEADGEYGHHLPARAVLSAVAGRHGYLGRACQRYSARYRAHARDARWQTHHPGQEEPQGRCRAHCRHQGQGLLWRLLWWSTSGKWMLQYVRRAVPRPHHCQGARGQAEARRQRPARGVRAQTQQSQFMFQYFLKVVSTEFRPLSGDTLKTQQYSVTTYERDLSPGANAAAMAGMSNEGSGAHISHGFAGVPGVFFNYEISPLKTIHSEHRQSLSHFLTSTCAIVGGILTVAGIVDSLVYNSRRRLRRNAPNDHTQEGLGFTSKTGKFL
ncbi:hypothetical protein L1887_50196 [Cichorium endivia]|nr:hypothetical protein L1887_50196 [Cichorium endivia]